MKPEHENEAGRCEISNQQLHGQQCNACHVTVCPPPAPQLQRCNVRHATCSCRLTQDVAEWSCRARQALCPRLLFCSRGSRHSPRRRCGTPGAASSPVERHRSRCASCGDCTHAQGFSTTQIFATRNPPPRLALNQAGQRRQCVRWCSAKHRNGCGAEERKRDHCLQMRALLYAPAQSLPTHCFLRSSRTCEYTW